MKIMPRQDYLSTNLHSNSPTTRKFNPLPVARTARPAHLASPGPRGVCVGDVGLGFADWFAVITRRRRTSDENLDKERDWNRERSRAGRCGCLETRERARIAVRPVLRADR